eukprot:6188399-Pleurochrysis_carterae.AAC.2
MIVIPSVAKVDVTRILRRVFGSKTINLATEAAHHTAVDAQMDLIYTGVRSKRSEIWVESIPMKKTGPRHVDIKGDCGYGEARLQSEVDCLASHEPRLVRKPM